MVTYNKYPSEKESRSLFSSIDTKAAGQLTYKKLKKTLRSNKRVTAYVNKAENFKPLLVPRIFNETANAIDKNGDGVISCEEFYSFCVEAAFRKNVEAEAFAAINFLPEKVLTRSNLPISLYSSKDFVDYIRFRSKYLVPLLSPSKFRRGLNRFVKEENLRWEEKIEDIQELIRICTAIITDSSEKPILEVINADADIERKRRQETVAIESVSSRAEEFLTMAMDLLRRSKVKEAIEYLSFCTSISPNNKVYRMALADAYGFDNELEKAMSEYEAALDADLMWSPPLAAYVKIHGILAERIKKQNDKKH